MIRWTWTRSTWTRPEKQPAHDTRTYAKHIRGRAFRSGRGWAIEVKNTATGDCFVFDNGHPCLAEAFADAEFATAAARQSWMRGFRQKDLKA